MDPQLVWKGKDSQDAAPLPVPAVPIYIQEKVSPQALIEDLRFEAQRDKPRQTNLFADFNGITFDKLVDFYHHDQNWTNRMVLGDSLLVMGSLAEKEGLKGKVQMIYVDPPYGIRFNSNWQVSTRERDVKDGKSADVSRQPEQVKAFRDTWELGIHSYLAYLRDRLIVARDLLTDSGSIFVQIGDTNLHHVMEIMDEVFGAQNRVSLIAFSKTTGFTSRLLSNVFDCLLWYAKDVAQVKYRPLFQTKAIGLEGAGVYGRAEMPDGTRRLLSPDELEGIDKLPSDWRIFTVSDLTSQGESGDSPGFKFGKDLFLPSAGRHWTVAPEGLQRLVWANRVVPSGKSLRYVRYFDDFPVSPISNIWLDTGTGSFTDPKVYVVQTGTKVVARCVLLSTDPGDLILDPTCGSGTTAFAAEAFGRRWITIDTSRVAIALARSRLMSAVYPYYLLADSPEGVHKESELIGRPTGVGSTGGDIRKGFVYERVQRWTFAQSWRPS